MEFFAKDSLRINILPQLLDGSVGMKVFLESGGTELPYADIRAGKGSEFRYNNFSIIEDSSGGSVTIRPVVVGCLAVFTVITPDRGFKIELIRKNAQSPERIFELWQGENRFALSPVGLKKYSLDFEGDEISRTPPESADGLMLENAAAQGGIAMIEREIAELMEVRSTLAKRRAALREKLAWMEANSRLDGTGDLAEIKETFGVDEEIISCYLQEPGGEDVLKLVEDVRRGIAKIEDRIREFVAHRARKTADIEKSLRTGG
ncbi:MAG: hypothetical protein LBI74_00215 [Synergistaceae bacterium]|nr:hypothetical protein [Synergistaceae bacterium]